MAVLEVTSDPFLPGRWTVRSDNLTALAATCDAIVQVLQLEGEVLAAWALHHDEQQGLIEHAYLDERRELGPIADVRVIDLPREHRPNVVWIDRVHLLASAAHPQVGSRLLGLYVGTKGRIVLAVHDRSVTAIVHQAFAAMPDSDGRGWEADALVSQCRVLLRADERDPHAVLVRAPQPQAMAVADALTRLQAMVAPW